MTGCSPGDWSPQDLSHFIWDFGRDCVCLLPLMRLCFCLFGSHSLSARDCCGWLIMGLPWRPISRRHGTQEVNSWKPQRLFSSYTPPQILHRLRVSCGCEGGMAMIRCCGPLFPPNPHCLAACSPETLKSLPITAASRLGWVKLLPPSPNCYNEAGVNGFPSDLIHVSCTLSTPEYK